MNAWVPLTLAATACRRPVQTLRTWVRRGDVPSACRVEDQAVLVWWPAVFDRTFEVDRRAARLRRTA